MEPNSGKIEMRTSSSCLNKLKEDGYTENFMVNEYGLRALDSEKYYTPAEIKVTNFFRFEGESDPGDSSILYSIETNDGIKGTLSDAFGAYGDEHVMQFMTSVEEIMKKILPKPGITETANL